TACSCGLCRTLRADRWEGVTRRWTFGWDLRVLRDQVQFPGPGDRLGPVDRAELGQNVADVPLDGVEGEDEFGGDVLVRPALGEQPQPLPLAGGQRVRQARHRGGRGLRSGRLRVEGPPDPGQVAGWDVAGGVMPAALTGGEPAEQHAHRLALVCEDPYVPFGVAERERRRQNADGPVFLTDGGEGQGLQRPGLDD